MAAVGIKPGQFRSIMDGTIEEAIGTITTQCANIKTQGDTLIYDSGWHSDETASDNGTLSWKSWKDAWEGTGSGGYGDGVGIVDTLNRLPGILDHIALLLKVLANRIAHAGGSALVYPDVGLESPPPPPGPGS